MAMRPAWLVLVVALQCIVPSASLSLDVAGAKNRPVSKVITLLKDMLKQLEAEQKEDEDVYDKLACWCETNNKEKTKSIKDAEDRIERLSTQIEELTARAARLRTEIKNLEEEVTANQNALAKATALREKQLAEFNTEEKETLESISALKAAVTVLAKHQTALLQLPKSHMAGIAATMQYQLQKHSSLWQGVLTPTQKKRALAFIQAGDYFDATPTFRQPYAPQSGEIHGILSQMLETFEQNLAAAQKEETERQKEYEQVKAAKEEQIAAGQAQINSKTDELATTDDDLAKAKEDKVDTEKSLSADEQFLRMLKEKCALTDKEWEERQNTRQQETQAVSKALAVLSGDDAHDLFTRTFNPSLLQSQVTAHSERRNKASVVLSRVAAKYGNPRLAALAYQVKLDAFTKVKEAIDKMIAELLKQKEDEIKHNDWCTSEFNSNQLQTEAKDRQKTDLNNQIDKLKAQIQELEKAIKTLEDEIKEMQVQLKRAGEDREKQNKEFQAIVADQRETQRLLKAALTLLRGFYGEGSAMVQQEPVGPPPPPGFDAYKNNQASGGVMQMIEQITKDASAMEKEAITSEEDAQKAYEDFVKETNNGIDQKTQDRTRKLETKAEAENDLAEAKKELRGVEAELANLATYKSQLHESCDYTLKNFDLRQAARDEEVEALRQAKAILSGANFNEFLQQS